MQCGGIRKTDQIFLGSPVSSRGRTRDSYGGAPIRREMFGMFLHVREGEGEAGGPSQLDKLISNHVVTRRQISK